LKSQIRWAKMCPGSLAISVDDPASFATVGAHYCAIAPSPSKRHPMCRSLLGISILLVLTVGCAQTSPTVSDIQTTQGTRQSVIDRVVDASVKIAIERDARRVTSASGIVIASRPATQGTEAVSYVLTAAHALAGGAGATIFAGFCGPDAARGKFVATVISQGTPETIDLALLRVAGIAVPSVALPANDQVRLGKQILVIGFPEGQRLGISAGIVSQLPLSEIQNGIPADRSEHRIVIDAAAPRGVSGGGVFEAETGRLIGVVQGYRTVSIPLKDPSQSYSLKFPLPGETFVVPMAQIRLFLTSPDVATELPDLLPVTARTTPVLPR
jgi:serine protease Do